MANLFKYELVYSTTMFVMAENQMMLELYCESCPVSERVSHVGFSKVKVPLIASKIQDLS